MTDKEPKSEEKKEKIEDNIIFSKENVNTGHQLEIDYLKSFIVFLMTMSHVYSYFCVGYLGAIVYFSSALTGGGGNMIMMGISMKYSRHQDIKDFISRGIVLLTMGQCLNLARDGLPNLIAWWITGEKIFTTRVLLFLQTDILIFAGIAFLFFSLLKKIKLSDKVILVIGIIMNNSAFLLYKIMKFPDNFLINKFLGFFIFTPDTESIFPFFSYFIYVAFGNWLGGIYLKISNKDKFYNLILTFCLPITVIYYYFRCMYDFPILPKFLTMELYSLNPGPDAIANCISNITILAICYKINKMIGGKPPKFITYSGKNFTQFYIIAYVITLQLNAFCTVMRGVKYTYEFKYPTLLGFIILYVSKLLIDMNNKYINFSISTLKSPMRNFVFAFVYIITIIILIYIYPKVEGFSTYPIVDGYTTQWNEYYPE